MTSSSQKNAVIPSSSRNDSFTDNDGIIGQTVESTMSKSGRFKQLLHELIKAAMCSESVSQEVDSPRARGTELALLNGTHYGDRRGNSNGNVSWDEIESNFERLAKDGFLLRADFAECIGIKDSKKFALRLFDALSRRRLNAEEIQKEELHKYWFQITNQNLESRLQLFFDMGDKDGDGRWSREEVKEIIMLSASTCKLPRLKRKADGYAALIMILLDPEGLGYIEMGQLQTLLFQKDALMKRFHKQKFTAVETSDTDVPKLGNWTNKLSRWRNLRVYRTYDVLLLIGHGTGATIFISILEDLINNIAEKEKDDENAADLNMSSFNPKNPIMTTNAYFCWVTSEEDSFHWLRGVMNEVADLDRKGIVEMHNYLTSDVVEIHEDGDTRSFLTAMVEALFHLWNCVDIKYRTKVNTHFAKPTWENVISTLGTKHPNATIGVVYCGTPTIGKDLSVLCDEYNQRGTAKFEFHKEHF